MSVPAARPTRRRLLVSTIVPLVVALSVLIGLRWTSFGDGARSAAPQAPAGQPSAAPTGLTWADCPKPDPQPDGSAGQAPSPAGPAPVCSRFAVPLEHAEPDGRTIALGLVKLPATGERRGSVVVNAGTQAGGGVAYVAGSAAAFAGLTEHFDVIGVDTRGTGTSVPAVRCTTHEQDRAIEAPIPAFQTTADRDARLTEATRITQTCAERSGDLLPYLSTTADARDLDLLRQALDEPQLRYLGISNGALLGQEYADLFPASTGPMVLDSPLDIDRYVRAPLAFDREQMVASEGTLQTFFDWCAAQGEDCAFGGGRPEPAFDALVQRMEHNRLANPDRDDIVTGGNLLQYVLGQLIFPAGWPELAQTLAGMAAQPLPLRPLPQGEDAALAEFLSHACLDKRLPDDLAAYDRQLAAATKASPHFGSMFGYGQLKCRQWPAEAVESNAGPWTHPDDKPVLVLAATDDPLATRKGVAAVVRRADAATVTVVGSGHVQLGKTPCVDDTVSQFFLDGSADRRTRCPVPLPAR